MSRWADLALNLWGRCLAEAALRETSSHVRGEVQLSLRTGQVEIVAAASEAGYVAPVARPIGRDQLQLEHLSCEFSATIPA